MSRHSVSPLTVDSLVMHADIAATIVGSKNAVFSGITQDSRNVEPGDILCCVRGQLFDGHQFISEGIMRGAVAVLVDHIDESIASSVVQIIVPDVRRVLGRIASAAFRHPASSLKMVGITGTNGKTTTASILGSLLTAHGGSVHVMGTLTGARTTPESIDLHAQLRSCVDSGVDHVVMEVSSHALEHHRVDGIAFDVAVFTNLGHDHLDFHGTMKNYFAAKRKLFTSEHARAAVVNADDPYGLRLQTEAVVPTSSYSLSNVSNVMVAASHVSFTWKSLDVRLPIGGSYAVMNALAAITAANELGVPDERIISGCASVQTVPGRFESVPNDVDIDVVVDFAHTPEALQGLLISAREIARAGLIVVFGCGGDRDHAKRPLMGDIASRGADIVIVTSDNPRSEDPELILAEVMSGVVVNHALVSSIVNREKAIESAILGAKRGDMVVIAGKGHETTQEINGVMTPSSDVAIAAGALRMREEKTK
ncbi:MAG: UDP-N-acetylmuramoyl-L-alanyl-D-glutamate--2,6-diaminopimelate ligase [Ilumatobacteraceae bacterium]|nr:UDP-N-acetylmuramoyl-L-alanyl-D-glutamate--2,6-diaminopimelate ligase [Ilumatobacteraceae bacterium]